MKEFELEECCSKCGFYSSEHLPDVSYEIGTFDKNSQQVILDYEFGKNTSDFLLRTCMRCGYKWAESCV